MKTKKFILAIAVCMLILTFFALAACDNSPEEGIIKSFNDVGKKLSGVSQTIEVKSGGMLIASEQISYDLSAGKATITKKVMNDLSADEAWTTTTETVNKAAKFDYNLSVEDFSKVEVNEAGTILKGTLNADAVSKLGVNLIGISAVSLEINVDGSNVVNLTVLSYTSANGNTVTISTSYKH